jgi:phytoene synthase
MALARAFRDKGACGMAVTASHGPAPAAEARAVVASSSFYLAMRILPREQRTAMFEVYAFCRGVDDAADAPAPHAERLARLAVWRRDVERLYAGEARSTRLAGLAAPVARFELWQEDFQAIIDGMMMDAREDIRAPDWATLDLYCDRVASAVGRLAVRIFGVPGAFAHPLAHHLGRALQLTNILRDLDEDAALGRLYLPREALAEAGITTREPQGAIAHASIACACAALVRRARGHFADAAAVMDACPRATVRSPRLMARVYATLLDELVGRGFAAPRRRVRIPRRRVAWAVVRSALA